MEHKNEKTRDRSVTNKAIGLNAGMKFIDIVERSFNSVFGEKNNIFYHLGSIPILLLAVLLVTGLYSFIFYSMAVNTAYSSIKEFTENIFLGNFSRSLHRYAGDAMMFFVFLHFLRMLIWKKFKGQRSVAWISGVALVVFMLIQGITGFLLPLDSNAHFVLEKTSEIMMSVRIFGNTLSRSFSSPDLMGKWIMWVIMIIHLFIPLSFVLLIFIHVTRISRARIFPTFAIGTAVVGFLVVFSFLFPIPMLPEADSSNVVFLKSMDWFYLFLATLSHSVNMLWVWAGFIGLIALLTILPFVFTKNPGDKAYRDLTECNGCTLCAKDCPYDAISMMPRTDGKKVKFQPEINLARCAGCGICAGACNFEAIGLQDLTHSKIEKSIVDGLSGKEGRWAVFICNRHSNLLTDDGKAIDGIDNSVAIRLPCTGMIGPVLVEKIQQLKAKGILISSCPEGDCQYREGNEWIQNRILKQRKPLFSSLEDSYPVFLFRFNSMENKDFVAHANDYIKIVEKNEHMESRLVKKIKTAGFMRHIAVSASVLIFLSLMFYYGSASNAGAIPPETTSSLIRIDFFYEAGRKTCSIESVDSKEYDEAVSRMEKAINFNQLSPEAQERIRENARKNVLEKNCSRERLPVELVLELDGKQILHKQYKAAGIQQDGITYVLSKQYVKPEMHELKILFSEKDGDKTTKSYDFVYKDDFTGGRVYFIDFNRAEDRFYLR